ncbi:MAG: hypothetical protein ACE5HN_00765 [Nitrospiria bacterium]
MSFYLVPSGATADGAEGMLTGKVTINGTNTTDAVVYLLRENGKPFSVVPMKKTIIQEDLQFIPSFSVVAVGSTIFFENRDDTIHNVRSRSPSNPFDIGPHLPNTIKKVILKNRGIVSLRCKVHQEMNGLIYVSPSPLFAVTDQAGHFEIKDIPFGTYQIETWHPSLTPKESAKGMKRIEVGMKREVIHLAFNAKAASGKDMTNIAGQNWLPVVKEIQVALEKAFLRWQKKHVTSAATKVMTAQSRFYRESGLREAIAKTLGEPRALDHEMRFDKIRKLVQGITKGSINESLIKKEIDILMTGLRQDTRAIEGL